MANLSAIERALRVAQERTKTPKAYASGGSTDPGLFEQLGASGASGVKRLGGLLGGVPSALYGAVTEDAGQADPFSMAGTTLDGAPEAFALGPDQIPTALGGRDMVATSEDEAGNLYNDAGEVIGNRLQLQRRLDEESQAAVDASSWGERPVAKAAGYLPEGAGKALSLGSTILAMPEMVVQAGKQYFDTSFPKPKDREETLAEGLTRGVGRLASTVPALAEGIAHTASDSASRLYGEHAGARALTDEERARAVFDVASLLPFVTATTGAARTALRADPNASRPWHILGYGPESAPAAADNVRGRPTLTPEEALASLTRSDPEAQAAYDAHLAEMSERPAIAMDTTAMDERMGLRRSPDLYSGKDEAAVPGIVTSAARDTAYGHYLDFMAKNAPDKTPLSWPEYRLDVIKKHLYDINLRRDQLGRLDPESQSYKDRLLAEARALRKGARTDTDLFSGNDEAALPGIVVSSDPKVRAAQKRAADVPFEDKLAVQHNMRGKSFAHNERNYDGNIPVPSLAISKAGQPLTNFGDISLFGDPSMAIPKGSNPVYPADAYTKRSPKVEMDVPNKADRDRMVEKLTGEKGKGYTLDLSDPYWDTNFRIGYLRSKGLTPPDGVRPDDWARNAIGYGERDAMEAFVNDFLDANRGLIRERINQGWSNDGERRIYKPHTLDNMVKASKGKAGSEDFDYGPNAWRAHTMRPFNSLAEIQENRGLINRVSKEEMDALKNDLAEKGFRLTEAMGYRDTYADMVLDGLRHPDPEVRQLAKELRDDLAKLPTEYFEAKPQRAVGFDEFKLAAVPETMPDVARSLDKRGLDVRTYDRSKMGEFGEPLTEILRSRPDLLFSNSDDAAIPGATIAGGRQYPMAPRESWYGDANYEQTGGQLTTMTPDEFLSRSRPMEIDEVARENIDDLKRHILEGGELDPLALYKSGREDGRHRAHAAKELGITEVPVLVWSNSDEASAPGVVAAADRMRRNQPFYGEDVGPSGRIADPAAEAQRLELRSGLAGAPSQAGFFNPATSALLQQGVQPKQTLAYYKKQMGARGGKLPPGMWERATEGLRPSDVVTRDWLAQQIDDLTPQFDVRSFVGLNVPTTIESRTRRYGDPHYQEYANRGPFHNYSETAVGYAARNRMKPSRGYGEDVARWRAVNEEIESLRAETNPLLVDRERLGSAEHKAKLARLEQLEGERTTIAQRNEDRSWERAGVKPYDDSHFDHENIEGWYRTQDTADNTRVLEEVQPQRNEKIREVGPARTAAEIKALKDQERAILTELDPIFMRALGMSGRGLAGSFDARGVAGLRQTLEGRAQTASAQGDNAAAAEMLAMSRQLGSYQEKLANIEGQIRAAEEGVNPSPYSHDVNAATDILLKNAMRDAVRDDVETLAWTPGEEQAKRYGQGQIYDNIDAVRYFPDTGGLQYRVADRGANWYRIPNPDDVSSGAWTPEQVRKRFPQFADRLLGQPKMEGMGAEKFFTPGHALRFEKPITIQFGGEGMKGFYGSGPTGEGGILTNRIQSLVKRVTGRDPSVESTRVGKKYQAYPAIELTPEFKEKAKRIGLSLYANDEKAGLVAAAVAGSKIPKEIDALGFYSPSLEAIKNIPQQKGTVAQFRAMILDKKYGGKPKELEAVGFDRAFPDLQAKVTRQQVEDFLRQNRIDLETIEGGGRFERYSTPGGVHGSYRETVTTLPSKHGTPAVRQTNPNNWADAANFVGPEDYASAHWPGITNPLLHYRTKDFRGEKLPLDHPLVAPEVEQYKREGKFDASQYTPQRGKTRLLDELQSDWAQRARDQGVRSPDQVAALKAERDQRHRGIEEAVNEAASILDISPHDASYVLRNGPVTPAARGNPRIAELMDTYHRLDNEASDLQSKISGAERGVPPAPYISNTSDWVDLGLRQALIEAARDPAVSRLAWTPGDVQNRRYNLSSHVDEITVRPQMEGSRTLNILMPDRGMLGFTVDRNGIIKNVPAGMEEARGRPVAELVGEELAPRIMEATRAQTFRGVDLDIGGEGQKGFYGVMGPEGTMVDPGIVGRRLLDLVKRIDPEAARIAASDVGQKFELVKRNHEGVEQRLGTGSREDLARAQEQHGGELRPIASGYPSIPFTPKLRQHILDEGMSLFANRDEAMLPGLLAALDTSDGPVTVNEIIDIPTPQNRVLEGGFYSVLDENIANSPMKAGTAQQWLNAAKKGEQAAKDSEIKWRALDRFFASRKPNERFTKEEVQDYLAQNKVEVSRWKNTEEGFDPEIAREQEIDNIRENLSYLDEDEIVERYGYRIEPVLSQRMRETYDKLKVEPVGNLDLFSDEPLYAVLDENGEVLSRGYATPEEAKAGALKDAERITQQRAVAEYEERTGQAWEGEPLGEMEGWQVFDKDGDEVGSIYDTEEEAQRAREDLIVRNEEDYIHGLSDDELADLSGDEFNGYLARTKRYLDDVPGRGRDYVEDVLVTDPKTIARLGSKGWPRNPGDLHPDAYYENAPGWTLRETYRGEGLRRGSGIALHEIQSRWGQAGEGRGWRSSLRDEEVRDLTVAHEDALAQASALEDQYARSVPGPYASGLAYKINIPQVSGARTSDFVYGHVVDIDDALYAIERRRKDNSDMAAGGNDERYTAFIRNNEAEIERLQARIAEREQALAEAEAEGSISRVSPEEMADPNSSFNIWNKEREGARLRLSEARNALDAAGRGVDPGPFVDDQAAFPLLLKQALIDAAEQDHDWVALSGPGRIAKRWGQRGAEDKYEKAAPNILGKLAKMHDKNAKVEPIYPGGFDRPRGVYDPQRALREAEAAGQQDFGFTPSEVLGGPLERELGFTKSHNKPIADIALRRDYDGGALYVLMGKDGSTGPTFSTRESAENAMRAINEDLAQKAAERAALTPETLSEAWKDREGEPYAGVRLSPQMRESIRKRGFPLFSNKDEAALPGIVMSSAKEKPLKELTQRQLDDLGLYSHLGETLYTVQMKSAVPLKWRSELKRQGVKDEELRWTGMDTWLASLPPNDKVPVEALKDYFSKNRVNLDKHVAVEKGYTEEGVRDHARENAEAPDYTVGPDPEWISDRIREHVVDLDEETGAYRVMDDYGDEVESGFASQEEADAWVRSKVEEEADSGDYESYAIFDESGERIDGDYSRDHAESAAYERASEDADYTISNEDIGYLREQYGLPLKEESSQYLDERPPGGRDYEEHLVTVPQNVLKRGRVEKPGIDAHFRDDLNNVLGWNLMESYEDAVTGGKIRNIHENQSDWGQRGVERGFLNASPEDIRAAEEASVLAEDALRSENYKFAEIAGGGVARILTGSAHDKNRVAGVLSDLRTLRHDMAQMKKDIADIEAGPEDHWARSKLGNLYHRQASNEQALPRLEAKMAELAPLYRLLDFSEEGMRPGTQNAEDIKAWGEWKAAVADLGLKSREARQAYEAMREGVAEGPFVTDTSDWTRLLLKNALYESAKRGDKYLSWSDPQTVIDRWGHEEGMNKHYGEVIPNVALKLAREHDPSAKLTDVFPSDRRAPSVHLRESESIAMGEVSRDPQLPFRTPFDGRYGPGRRLDIHQSKKIDHIVGVPHLYGVGDQRLAYQMVVKTPSGGEVRLDPYFRSKEAAEKAMALINEKLERGGRLTREEILREIEEEGSYSNHTKQQGIEITDRMRESIKKRGFRMFANEREAFLAGIAPALSDREAKIERALKIAGVKKPRSRLDIN